MLCISSHLCLRVVPPWSYLGERLGVLSPISSVYTGFCYARVFILCGDWGLCFLPLGFALSNCFSESVFLFWLSGGGTFQWFVVFFWV